MSVDADSICLARIGCHGNQLAPGRRPPQVGEEIGAYGVWVPFLDDGTHSAIVTWWPKGQRPAVVADVPVPRPRP